MKWSGIIARLRAGGFATALALFAAVLVVSLPGVFAPGQIMFSNDGPLGQLVAECHRLPARFTGCWQDLNSVGFNGGAAAPSISLGLQWLLGPVWFTKLYAILSLLILGLGAWCFFRQSKLSPLACLLGGLAVMLNSTFFSVACWGVGAHDITAGMSFLALAALADPAARQRWLRVILAGMALGMAVTEGADVGALFSLFVAAFIIFQAWTVEGPRVKVLAMSWLRLALVTVCAAFLAVQSIHGLMVTSINGLAGAEQDVQTKEERWDWATQWSLPKSEALNLLAPGVFGFRMNTPDGGRYWGDIGEDPDWETYYKNGSQGAPPRGFRRYSGGGNYVGGLVILVAFWTVAQSLRRKSPVFNRPQQKWLWFWLAIAVLSLLLSFGRYAPFYKLIYALPYFSTIRNPIKFLYFFSVAMVILFAFGVDGLCRRYMQPVKAGVAAHWGGLQNWWNRAAKFEKSWIYGCGLVWLAGLLAWWVYASHHDELAHYLQTAQVQGDPNNIASFSIRQAGWFVVVFFLGAGLLALIMSGFFAGRRAVHGGVCLTLLLAGDLALANRPWIEYVNYPDEYASNPVVDLLRDKPYEHRVATAPLDSTSSVAAMFSSVYRSHWEEHLFPYFNIQAFETVEMPRVPAEYDAVRSVMGDPKAPDLWFRLARGWQLTSVRYVLGPSGFAKFMNQKNLFGQDGFQVITRFELIGKPGVSDVRRDDQMTAAPVNDGPFAFCEFTAALPRAKLYSNWQIVSNSTAVLQEMFDPAFDPTRSVLVAGGVPASSANETNATAGTVEIVKYSPKNIALKADAAAPSILLLNDHFDPDWKVLVDDQPAKLLRCNFWMRGVQLAPGAHRVEFTFQPPVFWLYVSLSAIATTLLVLGVFAMGAWKNRAVAPVPAVVPIPAVLVTPEPVTLVKAGQRNANSSKRATGNRTVKR